MKIFYTAAFSGKSKYQKYYDLVRDAILSQKVELISPEIGNYQKLLTASDRRLLTTPRQLHYESIRKGITWADAVIIEISQECFQLGHEATLAIQAKKHVLCLSIHEDFSLKIQNRYFHAAKYSYLNVDEKINDFISGLRKHQFDQRFNLFLSQKELNYLDQITTKLGTTRSDYVRKLIDSDLLSHT